MPLTGAGIENMVPDNHTVPRGLALLLVLYIGCNLFRAEPGPRAEWVREYAADAAKCVRQTSDGGFILAGKDIVRLDGSGNVLWMRKGVMPREAAWVEPTSDGGFVVIDESLLVKTDGSGNEEWSTSCGGVSVQQVSDGGFITCGAHAVRLDSQGDSVWEYYCELGRSAEETTDGGFILAGYLYGYRGSRHDVAKLSAAGELEWWREYNTPSGLHALVVRTDANGHVALVTEDEAGSVSLLRITPQGDVVWRKPVRANSRAGWRIRADLGQGYVLAGGYGDSIYLARTDSFGGILWELTPGDGVSRWQPRQFPESLGSEPGTRPQPDSGGWSRCFNWAEQTMDGGYIAVEYSKSGTALTKYAPDQ